MPKPTLKSITKSPKALIIIALVVLSLFVLSSTPSSPANLGAVKLTGKQVQPIDYKIQSTTASLIPFKTAMVLDIRDGSWSSIVVSQNSIKISTQTLNNPQYKLYPTVQQLQEFEAIITRVNSGVRSPIDKLKLMVLWMQIKKVKNN